MSDLTRGPVPTTVRASFWLWIASVVISVIAVLVALASGQYTVLNVGGDAEIARAVAPWAVAGGVVIGGGLRVLFAVFLLRGKNWARIVLLIIAIITFLAGLGTVLSGDVFAILALIVTIVAAVLMYVSASNAYFRRA
jgi:hypothetical protein